MTTLAEAICTICTICPHYGICGLHKIEPEHRFGFCAYVPVERKSKQIFEGRHQPPILIPGTDHTYERHLKEYIQEHQQ